MAYLTVRNSGATLLNPGIIIKLLRTAEGISQTRLAGMLGVSRSYLSQVENGRKQPSLPLLRQVSQALSIPLPLLVLDESQPDSDVLAELRKILCDLLAARTELTRGPSLGAAGALARTSRR